MKHAAAFQFFADLIKTHSGITIGEDKLYLVETRLAEMCRENGCRDITELHRKLGTFPPKDTIRQIVECMTTNETWWFRDGELFNTLKTVLWPHIAKNNLGRVNMWCAASSTGQEPYSLKITWESNPDLATKAQLHILGTDIDTKALDRCREGIYSQLEIGRGMPTMELITHFDQSDNRWKIKPGLQRNIEWRQLNLLQSSPAVNKFDIVLCRNVLIYFDPEGKQKVLNNILQSLKPKGVLILGGSESLFNVKTEFVRGTIGKVFCYGRQEAVDEMKTLTA